MTDIINNNSINQPINNQSDNQNTSFTLQPVQTPSDGNCFFYAFFQALYGKHIDKQQILDFKQSLKNQLSIQNILTYLKDEVKIIILKLTEQDKTLNQILERDFDSRLHLVQPLLEHIQTQFQNHISQDGVWPEDWAQQFCAKIYNVNIIVYMDTCNKLTPIHTINPNLPCIILFNKNNSHWETGIIKINKSNTIFSKFTYNTIKNLL